MPTDEEIREAFTALRVAERAHKDAARRPTPRARPTSPRCCASALAVRDPERLTDDCPVCGTPDVLDDAWAQRSADASRPRALDGAGRTALDARPDARRSPAARRARRARCSTRNARAAPALARAASALADATPTSVARRAPTSPRATLDDARPPPLRALSERATAELARRGAAWQELSTHVAAWLEEAHARSRPRAATLKALKDAEKWVKGAAEELRRERFAPISERAIANWRELRQGSSVDLHEITLKKSAAAAGRTSTSAPTARTRTRSA